MKKFLLSILSAFLLFSGNELCAQEDYGYFNSLGVGVNVGLSGVGVNLATPIGNYLALRAGVVMMPNFKLSTDVDVEMSVANNDIASTLEVGGEMGRVSGELLLNFYPIKTANFFIVGGAYFGGDKLVKVSGHSDEIGEYVSQGNDVGIAIGDCILPIDKNGNVSGGLKVSSFRPYLGLGFGRPVPRKRLGVMFEAGVQFHGTPEVYSDLGTTTSTTVETDDTFSDIIEKVKVYPVIKLTLSGRIF